METITRSSTGGQKVYRLLSLELVVVFTGGAFNAASPGNDVMTRALPPAMRDAGTTIQPPAAAIDHDDSHLIGKAAASC